MAPDLLAEISSLWGEGESGDRRVFAGEVLVEPVGSGGEDGVVVEGNLVPLGDVWIVFLILYPETGQGGGGGGEGKGADGRSVFGKINHY